MGARTIDTVGIASFVTVRDTEEQFAVVRDEHNVVIAEGQVGPPGAKGDKGDKGDQGTPGLSGVSYVHDQSIADSVWVVVHNLGRFPSVMVIDSAGDEVEGSVRYDSANQITVTFSAPFGGKAFLN